MSLYPIPVGLAPVDKNKLTNYWPIRNKGNEFDWDTVTGVVLGLSLRKQVTAYEFEQFKEECKARLWTSSTILIFGRCLNEPIFK